MDEVPSVTARREIDDEIVGLGWLVLLERSLQGVVVIRGDDELIPAFGASRRQNRWKIGEQVMQRRRLTVTAERLAQAVVQGSVAVDRVDVLRDPREIPVVRGRVLELSRQPPRQLGAARQL